MDAIVDEERIQRLIVVIPDYLVITSDLAHKIHWMADKENLSILYLVLVDTGENNLAVSRRMATMKAITSANRLPVEVKQMDTGQWLQTLREVARPGDVIIQPDKQTIVDGKYQMTPVSEYLSRELKMPVQIMSGFHLLHRASGKRQFSEFLKLLGFLVILGLFTWLEIQMDLLLEGSPQKLFIMGLFCFEVAAIWAWSKFGSR